MAQKKDTCTNALPMSSAILPLIVRMDTSRIARKTKRGYGYRLKYAGQPLSGEKEEGLGLIRVRYNLKLKGEFGQKKK